MDELMEDYLAYRLPNVADFSSDVTGTYHYLNFVCPYVCVCSYQQENKVAYPCKA